MAHFKDLFLPNPLKQIVTNSKTHKHFSNAENIHRHPHLTHLFHLWWKTIQSIYDHINYTALKQQEKQKSSADKFEDSS